jgi:hypothetical protein
MTKQRPSVIHIMPDYGPCYASDEQGGAIDLTDYFEDHPQIDEIRAIEVEFYALAKWIDSFADSKPDFPWPEIDKAAIELTHRLVEILKDTGFQIMYRRHYNNPFV